MRLRVLPLAMFMAFTLVVVKVSDIVIGTINGESLFLKMQALAQEEGGSEDEGTVKDEEAKLELGGFAEDAEWSPGEHKGPKKVKPSEVSEMERNILENLAKRREELEKWSASISMKENILNATEKKINRKMDELKSLQQEVATLLAEYNGKESQKVKRLVRIYENMKAKDAARIFEEMDLAILLEVVGNMKEAKAAPILAKMEPLKAKEITIRLAKQRRLSVTN